MYSTRILQHFKPNDANCNQPSPCLGDSSSSAKNRITVARDPVLHSTYFAWIDLTAENAEFALVFSAMALTL